MIWKKKIPHKRVGAKDEINFKIGEPILIACANKKDVRGIYLGVIEERHSLLRENGAITPIWENTLYADVVMALPTPFTIKIILDTDQEVQISKQKDMEERISALEEKLK